MDKEIKRRKKHFWVFCLAALLVLCNMAPMIVEAKEYFIVNGEVTPLFQIGTYIYPGDVFNFDGPSGGCFIDYYDVDDTLLSYHTLGSCNSVKSYLEAGGKGDADSFICWSVVHVVTSGGSLGNTFLEGISLKAICGTKKEYYLSSGWRK